MTLDAELLSILACPVCRGSLETMPRAATDAPGEPGSPDTQKTVEGLACQRCAAVYPVRDEIPVMLAEEAVPAREWAQGKREAAVSPKRP